MHQMRLAKADAAVEEQRIEAGAGWLLGDAPRAGVSEFIRLADDECIERETRIDLQFRIADPPCAAIGRHGSAVLLDVQAFARSGGRRRWPTDANFDPADRRTFRLP